MTDETPIYKHIIVPVQMDESYETRTLRRQTGTRTVQKSKGLLNPEKVTKEEPVYEYVEESLPTGQPSDTNPASAIVGEAVEAACNDLAKDGYGIISITPILRGVHGHEISQGVLKKGTGITGHSFGFGYSVTDSILIIAKRGA